MALKMDNSEVGMARIATLGMFIIDTFKFFDDQGNQLPAEKEEQIGGGGTYFIIGARHFLPPSQLAQIIDIEPSSCFQEMIDTLKSFGKDMFWFRTRQDGEPTARGLNAYTGQGRDFSMLSKGVRVWPEDLVQSPAFFQPVKPGIVHTTCSPERAAIIIQQIDKIRSESGSPDWKPALIWEILPPDCIPQQMPLISKICSRLSVLSPNHTEALAMFGLIPSPYLSDHQVSAVYPSTESLKKAIEDVTRRLFRLVVGKGGASVDAGWDRGVIVRCGAFGCCVARQRYPVDAAPADTQPNLEWIDAYWTGEATPDFQSHIVDVTGGGNAFLGGLAAGMRLSDGDLLKAAFYATVSASYAIEQDGLPHLQTTADGEEYWNGDLPLSRLEKLKVRQRIKG